MVDGPVRAPVEVGETLAGKYRIERIIGAGGMGVVVAATHLVLEQKVAIKFLLAAHAADKEQVERFGREARALAKIESDNVARVIDVGTLPDGASYMVMEYLEGSDLAAVLRQRGPIPHAQAVGWVLEACEAITEAHNAGIVHRDLKPANLFLAQKKTQKTIIKVLDFGISKSVDASATQQMLALTKTATLLGSPLYMAPEQLRSVRDLDGRTDIWALGVILHELLTAKPPFLADSLGALVSTIQHDASTPVHVLRPDVPEALSAIVLRCLEKKREDRYPTVADLMTALVPFALATQGTTAPMKANIAKPPVSNLASTLPLSEPSSGAISPAAETTGGGGALKKESTTGPRLSDAPAIDATARMPEGTGRDAWAGTKGGADSASITKPSPQRNRTVLALAGLGLLVLGGFAIAKLVPSASNDSRPASSTSTTEPSATTTTVVVAPVPSSIISAEPSATPPPPPVESIATTRPSAKPSAVPLAATKPSASASASTTPSAAASVSAAPSSVQGPPKIDLRF